MPIKLIKMSENHLEDIRQWRMLPEITKYMYTEPNLTSEDQIRWFNIVSNSSTEKYWIIQMDNIHNVGLLSLNKIDVKNSQCSWAYYIADSNATGRGLAKTLECNIYDYVFYTLELNKLWCEVFTFNEIVIKLHQLFGSEIEGEFKDHIYKNGQFYDVVRMSINKKKWEEIKSKYKYSVITIE